MPVARSFSQTASKSALSLFFKDRIFIYDFYIADLVSHAGLDDLCLICIANWKFFFIFMGVYLNCSFVWHLNFLFYS